MKKKFLLPLLLLCVGFFGAAVGCGETTEPSGTNEIVLNKEEVVIQANQEYWLIASYDGDGTPVWSVADSSIVSVENGKLVGLKPGTTTVTVSLGALTDSCTVTVAELSLEKYELVIAKTNVSLYREEQSQIEASVTYDGEEIEEALQKSYVSANPDVVSVDENGKLTAKAYGNATISVVYTFGNVELSGTVNVRVVSNGKIEIEQSIVELDMSEENKTTTLTAKAYEKGVEKTDAEIVWATVEGQDVILLEEGKITALNAGETTVTAKYVDLDGATIEDTVVVTVSSITVDTTQKIVLSKDECKDGYALDTSILGTDVGEITGAYVLSEGGLKTQVPYADGKYNLSSLSTGLNKFYAQTRNVEYILDVELWTAKISTASDLKEFLTGFSSAADGWYQLEEDITVSGKWTYEVEMQFNGLFDGMGHTITFTTDTGLFHTLTRNAMVKNVTLNATVQGGGAIAKAVESGANAVIENVNVFADVWGTGNAGFINSVSGSLILKNAYGVVSKANESEENGAMFASVTYAPTLENVQVYSVLALCAKGALSNAQAEALNAMQGIVIAPTLLEKTGRFTDFETAGDNGLEIEFAEGEYVSYTVYGNVKREVAEATDGTLVLTLEDVENRKSISNGQIGGNVDVLFKKADGSVEYYSMILDSTYYLNNANFKKYLTESGTTLSGYYALEEDITLSGNWKSKVLFNGILDGKGYKITGLKPNNGSSSGNGGLFWRIQNATFKNLVMEDVIANRNMGTFAYQHVKGTSTFENVYVSFVSTRFDSNSGDGTNVGGTYANIGGFFSTRRAANNSGSAVVTNCVVYMPEHLTVDSGYIAGSASYAGALTISNCTFIGGNGKIAGGANSEAIVTTDDNTKICDAVSAHKALQTKQTEELTTPEKAFLADHKYVELSGANFVEKWATLTDETVVLTEDVDFANLTGIEAAANFTGVFDGQNHKISNVNKTLFSILGGSLKNVALTNCSIGETSGASCAIIADTVAANTTAYLENVYVDVVKLACDSANRASAICRVLAGGLSMKNVVVYCHGTESCANATFVGLIAKPTTIVVENCQFINEWETEAEIANTTDASYQQTATVIQTFFVGLTTYTAKADFVSAVTAGTVTPTDFVKELLIPTNA